jgi:hypothetical protein
MTANEIKIVESGLLRDYMATLPYGERKYFIKRVVEKCGNGVTNKTFYNWEYMACRMPDFAKRAIEEVAGKTIFIWDDRYIY